MDGDAVTEIDVRGVVEADSLGVEVDVVSELADSCALWDSDGVLLAQPDADADWLVVSVTSGLVDSDIDGREDSDELVDAVALGEMEEDGVTDCDGVDDRLSGELCDGAADDEDVPDGVPSADTEGDAVDVSVEPGEGDSESELSGDSDELVDGVALEDGSAERVGYCVDSDVEFGDADVNEVDEYSMEGDARGEKEASSDSVATPLCETDALDDSVGVDDPDATTLFEVDAD